MKTVVKGPENRQELVQTRLGREGLLKERSFEFRVKLMRGPGKWRSRISIAVTSDGGAEGCHSLLGRKFQSTGAWWVKDLSVTLRCKRNDGRWRVMMSEEQVLRLD